MGSQVVKALAIIFENYELIHIIYSFSSQGLAYP